MEKKPDNFIEIKRSGPEKLVPQGQVAAVRAQVRNSCRSVLEKWPLVGRIFHAPHLPAVTPEDVREDEERFCSYVALQVSEESGSDEREVLERLRGIRNMKSNFLSVIENEEQARYMKDKMVRFMSSGQYSKGRRLLASIPLVFHRDENMMGFAQFTVEPHVQEHLEGLLHRRDAQRFISAYLKLGSYLPLKDLSAVECAPQLKADPSFQKVLRQDLAEKLRVHPFIYEALRRKLVSFGLLDEDGLAESQEIRDAVWQTLFHCAQTDVSLYTKMRDLLDDVDLFSRGAADQSEILFESVVRQLAAYMVKSPYLYRDHRDKWEREGLISAVEMDSHPMIRQALDDFLLECIEVHPSYYEQFRRMVTVLIGVHPQNDKKLEIALWSKMQSSIGTLNAEQVSTLLQSHERRNQGILARHARMVRKAAEDKDAIIGDFIQSYPHMVKETSK